MSTITTGTGLGSSLRRIEGNWGWFVFVGAVLLIAGGIASINLFASSLASVLYIAVMMLIGGASQIVHAFTTVGWQRRVLYALSAIFYIVASAILIHDPILSAVDISLVIGGLLIVAGIFRIATGIRDRAKSGSSWIIASGVLTAVVGVAVYATWPAVGFWLLGGLLTVDLIFQGWGYIAFGLALRTRGKGSISGGVRHA